MSVERPAGTATVGDGRKSMYYLQKVEMHGGDPRDSGRTKRFPFLPPVMFLEAGSPRRIQHTVRSSLSFREGGPNVTNRAVLLRSSGGRDAALYGLGQC